MNLQFSLSFLTAVPRLNLIGRLFCNILRSLSTTQYNTVRATLDYTVRQSPNVYALPTDPNFGVYTYKGGLTTPPCTEMVNWNLLDTPMIISDDQLNRLYHLILCYVDPQTCLYATIASIDGSTSRPLQPLKGRKVLHRCRTCEGCPTVRVDGVTGRAAAAAAGGNGSLVLFLVVLTSILIMTAAVFLLWTLYSIQIKKKKEQERVNALLLSPSEYMAHAYHAVVGHRSV